MSITSSKEFGALIRRIRKDQGLTQADLAGASGVSIGFIIDLEKGKVSSQLDKSLKIARMLGIKLEAVEPPPLDKSEWVK